MKPEPADQQVNALIDIKLSRCQKDLAVEVCLPPGERGSLASIQVVLDGLLINPERAPRHHRITRYRRRFQQLTQWFPGPDHQLSVTARTENGLESRATLRWTDL